MDVERLSAIPGKDGEHQHALENIKTLAENSVTEVRNLALLLRRRCSMTSAWLRRSNGRRAKYPSARNAGGSCGRECLGQLAQEHKTCVYRIVQEALNNCSKHAYAKHVQVTICQKPGRLSLTIQDDGKGFDPVRARGLGLVGMTERVSQLNGILKVDSVAGRGTSLRVDLPLVSTPENRDRVAS